MSQSVRLAGRRHSTEWALLLAAVIGLGAALAAWRWHEYGVGRVEHEHRLEVQARGLGQHLELLLQSVDRVLKIAEAGSDGDPMVVARQLDTLNDASIAIRGLQLLNVDGSVRVASAPGGRASFDQPCFQRARARPAPTALYACAPFRTAAGAWSVNLLHARQRADGGFDGAVAATLDMAYLAATLPSALYASDMRAFLLGADGVVIASAQSEAYSTGTDLTKGPGILLGRFLARRQPSGVVEGVSTAGGQRIVAFRHLRPAGLELDGPLLIAVSRGLAAAYRDWTLATLLCAAGWLLVAGAAAAALQRAQRMRRSLADEALALRQQRLAELERLELIVGGADLSLWVWYVANQHLEIDARWCAMVGCPADDLAAAALTWRRRIHPEDIGRLTAVTRLTGADGVTQFEYRLRHDAGHWVWLLGRGKVVESDAAGRPVRVAGTNIDITERKQVERALKSSEASLSATLRSIGDAVIATDAHGRIERMNPTAEQLTGWSADAALGRDLPEVFHIIDGHSRQPVMDPVQYVLAKGEAVGFAPDTLLIARDGSERQIADTVAPIRGAAGAISGAVLVFSDVTEPYRVQQALRDSEAQLRLITDAMPATVARYDLARRILFANRAHEGRLGVPATSLIGRTLTEVYGADTFRVLEPYALRVETGQVVNYERDYEHATLGRRRVQATLVPDFDDAGTVRGHISIVTDITEHRELEEHLRDSQKMDSIGTLAGGIAHDFNNVLGAIIGNAELALQELDAAHAAHFNLQQISRASQRARSLVQKILTFSRHEPQLLVAQPLQPLIDETLGLLRSTLPARVELVAEIGEEPLYVSADATQIQQLLMNLGTNAWHALKDGAGRIVVGLKEVALSGDGSGDGSVTGLAAGRYAWLSVRDDGVGMDASTRQRIFEPFFTTKPVGQGTGLGLSVVHGIVKTHLGSIVVDTAPGKGTSVHVYLPATQRPSQVGALDEAEARTMRGRGQHVMVVDDDEVMVVMVEQLLARAGYRVTVCADAKQALAAFAERPRAFDIVVTDFNMPDFSGLELAAELARVRPELPVVISSGYLSDELRTGAGRVGIRHLLQKQNSFEELALVVHRALADADARREAMG